MNPFRALLIMFTIQTGCLTAASGQKQAGVTAKSDSGGCGTVEYLGVTYHTVMIGTQCWMAENLNVGKWLDQSQQQYHTNNGIIEKYCYNNDFINCDLWGGLYQWDEAVQYTPGGSKQGICPQGWHIPDSRDWAALIKFAGGNSLAGAKMKSTGNRDWQAPNVGADNSSGFTAFPGGYFDYMAQQWYGQFTIAHLWSSEIMEKGTAVALTLYNNNANADLDEEYMPSALSVRCLKNQ